MGVVNKNALKKFLPSAFLESNHTQASVLTATHLVGVGARDADGVEQVFQAVWDGPEVQCHFSCHQRVGVVKQVDVAPGQRTVLLQYGTKENN